jgi:hypothetical protein
LGAVCWLKRNDFLFRNRLIPNPNAILYSLLFFMQRWTILSLVAVQDELEKLIDAIKTHLPQDTAARVG